jgi:hypothetical protein
MFQRYQRVNRQSVAGCRCPASSMPTPPSAEERGGSFLARQREEKAAQRVRAIGVSIVVIAQPRKSQRFKNQG